MNYRKNDNHIILSLQTEDYINKSIKKVFIDQNLNPGWVSGLGAVYGIELGYYDLGKKDYMKKDLKGSTK